MNDYSDPIIFGKNTMENVVSVEANDGHLEVFTEKNGIISSQFIPNKYWLLSNEPLDSKFVRMKGDLHYKYGRQYEERKEFLSARSKYKKFNKDTYSIYDGREASLINKGICYYKNMLPKDVSILAFDLETTGINHDDTSKILLIANTYRKNGVVKRRLFSYDDFENEGEMIREWCKFIKEINPSIICGHNIFGFDFQYLKFIANKFNVSLDIGRDGSNLEFYKYESSFRVDGSRDQDFINIRCYGREIVDTMFLMIKKDATSKKYESYGLKNLIKEENMEVDGRVFYDASQIRYKYKNPDDWKLIKQYAIMDGDDALNLFDFACPAYFYMTNSIPKPFQQVILSATGSQINSMMVRSYLQNGHSISKADIPRDFEGAISWGRAGIYDNVIRFDVASLYPSLIIAYKIYSKEKDPDGNFLKLVTSFRDLRFEYKKKSEVDAAYHAMQLAFKELINSAYGACSTNGLNFNYLDGADEITRLGRETLKNGIKFLTSKTFEEWKNG